MKKKLWGWKGLPITRLLALFRDLTWAEPAELIFNAYCISNLPISVADPVKYCLSCFDNIYQRGKTTTNKIDLAGTPHIKEISESFTKFCKEEL
jgi:hypothetical protein